MPLQLEGLGEGLETRKRRKIIEQVTNWQRECLASTFGKNAIINQSIYSFHKSTQKTSFHWMWKSSQLNNANFMQYSS
jgi:hypothetical protein